ncbi:hypothetical protein [Spongorhabdus nitratireducens]
MKKQFLAIAVAASLMTGCASNGGEQVNYAELQVVGQDLYAQSVKDSYQPSLIEDVEVVRTSVNAVFLIAKPAYEQYTDKLLQQVEIQTYFAAVEAADSEEDKRAIYDNLDPETKAKVDAFVNSDQSQQIMASLAEASKVALQNIALFKQLDSAGLLKQVSFSDLMAEKDKLAFTGEQIVYLNDTVVSAYKNYQQISAFSKAQ